MKGYKPFSRKYYTEDLKILAKSLIRYSSHLGRLVHDTIEGRNHDTEAYKFGGSCSFSLEDENFYYQVCIRRKSLREKRLNK